jgi:hypothetical protein
MRVHRKRLHRAASLLQALFYAWREASYNWNFHKIDREVDDDESVELLVYESSCHDGMEPACSFPHEAVSTQPEKEALLAFDSACHIPPFFAELSCRLLRGKYLTSHSSAIMAEFN